MKRTIGIVASLAALGVGAVLTVQGMAQTGQNQTAAPAAGPLRTRVALVNLSQVLKGYTKFKNDFNSFNEQIKQIESTLTPMRDSLVKMKNDYPKTVDPAEKEKLEKDMRRLQMQMQEQQEDAQKKLGKQQGEMAVRMYHEVEDAVKAFAQYNDIEMVLMYNDADKSVPNDYYNPKNVSQKMMLPGALMPLYSDQRMDITPHVLKMLNDRVGTPN